MSDDIDMTGWPAGWQEIAGLIGSGAAFRLMDAYAGREKLTVPKVWNDNVACRALAEAIGEPAARTLIHERSSERLDIPTLAVQRYMRRKRAIREATGRVVDVARRFGVTPRWVRLVKNEGRADVRQMDLFGDE